MAGSSTGNGTWGTCTSPRTDTCKVVTVPQHVLSFTTVTAAWGGCQALHAKKSEHTAPPCVLAPQGQRTRGRCAAQWRQSCRKCSVANHDDGPTRTLPRCHAVAEGVLAPDFCRCRLMQNRLDAVVIADCFPARFAPVTSTRPKVRPGCRHFKTSGDGHCYTRHTAGN